MCVCMYVGYVRATVARNTKMLNAKMWKLHDLDGRQSYYYHTIFEGGITDRLFDNGNVFAHFPIFNGAKKDTW